jgi:hypothetical protein
MKKRIIIVASVILAFIALMLFTRLSSSRMEPETYTDVKRGPFEITVSNSGELLAEKSLDISGPVMANNRMQGGRGGQNFHFMDLKIQDIIPEGTIVGPGDYIAQLDRSSYSNTLKDALDQLKTYETNVEMKVLDTAVVLTNLRDEIKNQRYTVEEAKLTLEQSKYEPPATIRQAEIALDRANRTLDQKIKGYDLRVAQTLSEINHEKMHLQQQQELVSTLQEFLGGFTIKAPSGGMVIYKKERTGTKRKAGSNLNPFDMVVATLPDLTTMLSKVYVNEIDVSKIQKGQEVEIKVDAFPQKVYRGDVVSIANIGEQLPNSDAKMFEVQIKLRGSDPSLRPSMTTSNKIFIKTYDNAVYIPSECVMAGVDSIPFVYEKNGHKQVVVLGEANDKNVIIEQGLETGDEVYVVPPKNTKSFKLTGEELIAVIREKNKAKKLANSVFVKPASGAVN